MNQQEKQEFTRRCECLGNRFRQLLHTRDRPDGIRPDIIFLVEYPKGETHYITFNTSYYGTWRWPYILDAQAEKQKKDRRFSRKESS